MKKHLLFVAMLFAFNIGKILAQHPEHHRNDKHFDDHHYNYQNTENNFTNGCNSPCNQPSFSIFKLNIQAASRTKIIVDGINYGYVQNNIDGVKLKPGKHLIQLMKIGIRDGSYLIFSGDVWIKPNSIAIGSFSRYEGLVITQTLMNVDCETNYNYSTYNYAVDEHTFCNFKKVIKNAWFDSDKQKLICDFLSRNYVNSNQVEELICLMDFESTKLKIAKEAYTKVIDKNNYYIIFNQFDFESSKRELSEFMANC